MKSEKNKQPVSDSKKLEIHRQKQAAVISKYRSHYNREQNKIAVVHELTGIKNQCEKKTEQIKNQIKPVIDELKLTSKFLKLDSWIHHIKHVYGMATAGADHTEYYREWILKHADELKLTTETKYSANFVLEGCTVMAKWSMEASALEQLINHIIDNNYPAVIGETENKEKLTPDVVQEWREKGRLSEAEQIECILKIANKKDISQKEAFKLALKEGVYLGRKTIYTSLQKAITRENKRKK